MIIYQIRLGLVGSENKPGIFFSSMNRPSVWVGFQIKKIQPILSPIFCWVKNSARAQATHWSDRFFFSFKRVVIYQVGQPIIRYNLKETSVTMILKPLPGLCDMYIPFFRSTDRSPLAKLMLIWLKEKAQKVITILKNVHKRSHCFIERD